MSVEASFATVDFMGDSIPFGRCPGSIEFPSRAMPVLAACDLAVVVAEADEQEAARPPTHHARARPPGHSAHASSSTRSTRRRRALPRDTLKMLQPAETQTPPAPAPRSAMRRTRKSSSAPSIWALERAIHHTRSTREPRSATFPTTESAEIERAPTSSMLEKLADHDDAPDAQQPARGDRRTSRAMPSLTISPTPICGKGIITPGCLIRFGRKERTAS